MKRTSFLLLALVAAALGVSIGSEQQPPPPPAQGAPVPPPPAAANGLSSTAQPASVSRGTIKAFNSGPNGETNGLILGDGTTVFLPPDMGEQVRMDVREGSQVTFTGISRTGTAGRMVVDAQTLTANGQTFTAPVEPTPAP